MTTRHRTARNVLMVSAASFVQIFIQFLFQRVLAGIYGAGVEADALAAALALPTLFAAVVTGSLSYVLVPELVSQFGLRRSDSDKALDSATDSDKQGGDNSAWRLASFVGVVTCGVSVCFSLLLFFFADAIGGLLYGRLPPPQLQLTNELLRILSVQVVLSGAMSWAQAVHHSRHRFAAPALGGVVGMSLSLAWAHLYGGKSIVAIAWAINAGSLLGVVVQLAPLATHLKSPRADYQNVLKLCRLFRPLLLGASVLRLDPLVDRVLAARLATDDPGAIAYINYAQRILAALLAIGTSSLAVVAFPQLAQRLEGEGLAGFAKHFSLAFRRLILLVVPIALGFSLFSVWIIRDLLQHGAFTPRDSAVVGWLIVAQMGMFVGASCAELLARGYYVLGDTRTPTLIGVLALLVGWGVKLWLFSIIGIWGIALGVSAYCLLSAVGMAWWLSRRFGHSLWADSPGSFLQSLLSACGACVFCYGVYLTMPRGTFVAAPMGAGAYFLFLLLLRNADAEQLWSAIRLRIKFWS